MIKKLVFVLFYFVLFLTYSPYLVRTNINLSELSPPTAIYPILQSTPTPAPLLKTSPRSKIIPGGVHVFQTFNNCGPASLSMAFSLMGVDKSQDEIGRQLRPYQNPQGDNDDKSVTLYELAKYAEDLGYRTYYRPNGNFDLVKKFISYDIPVIVRTTTKINEDIGHYRVIKGYDESERIIIQDDSLQGKNLKFTYTELNILWEKFNYEYLVIVPKDLDDIAIAILGDNFNLQASWKNAESSAQKQLDTNSEDIYARFNHAISLYHIGNYSRSVSEFEKIEKLLPFRTLWYQIEPILAYQKLANYQRVFLITDKIIANGNRAFSELYQIRGEIYQEQGRFDLAQEEFNKAFLYNSNFWKYWE